MRSSDVMTTTETERNAEVIPTLVRQVRRHEYIAASVAAPPIVEGDLSWRRASFPDIREIGHVSHQAIVCSDLRVTGHQLALVLSRREIERVCRVVVDQHQISVDHGELPKPKRSTSVVHEIAACDRGSERTGRLLPAKLLEHDAIGNPRFGEPPANSRRRQHVLRIQEQIIATGL